ncbi:hypothetical protein [Oceanidesulfovibrio marinus]|uniref:Glycosyltransferase RgtA/B/C/D-like domain-containing protein n=1 Tax=Oceanidesulfovibrio marinus TaxID=370038 RepID=A0ABX6NKA7_9BACT|nr:hypothetical protein [Oceanidesulfovibrio marinus]QJT10137.1 hypothetical protein E8L03_14885 [Oceanidesulfovibrio marinus]
MMLTQSSSRGLQHSRGGAPLWPTVLAWSGFVALALLFLLYITPRKGAFFGDEGWYLYSALRALRHGELNLFLPQAPAYLFNTGFMAVLGEGYLPLRWVYTIFSLAAGLAVMAGIDGAKAPNRFIIPLGLCCVLFAGLSSLVNYQNGPSLFLLMGLGLYWLSRKAGSSGVRVTVWLASGFFLACSAMVNLTIAPGLAVLCLWLLYTAWRKRDFRSMLAPLSCGVFLALMLGIYLSKLGLAQMFSVPKGHGFHYERALEILAQGALMPACWGVYWLIGRVSGLWPCVAAGVRKLCGNNPAAFGLFIATLTVAAYLARFLLVMAQILPGFPLSLIPATHPLIIMPQYAYAVLCLAVFYGDWSTKAQRRGALCAVVLIAYWAQQTFYSDIPVNISMVFASGYFMALGLVMLSARMGRAGRIIMSVAAVLFVAGCMVHIYYGGWTTEVRPVGPKVELDNPRFQGILESPERAETFARIKQAYDEFGCANKALITFRNSSLIYYFLDHKAPPRLSYISQNYGMYYNEIRAILDSGKPWCVFYSENVDLLSNKKQESKVMRLVEEHADKRMDIGHHPPRHLYDDFVVFTGPAETGFQAGAPAGNSTE